MKNADRIRTAFRVLIEAIGENPTRQGLTDTPDRAARAWRDLTVGYTTDPADYLDRTFDQEYDLATDRHGIVLVRDIPFYSLCEHHLLPFFGTGDIAYIPDQKIVGISKLARTLRGYAARLQIQERLTNQVVNAIVDKLDPIGAACVVRAEHLCMGMRGVKAPGSITVTSAVAGHFYEDEAARAEVFKLMEDR